MLNFVGYDTQQPSNNMSGSPEPFAAEQGSVPGGPSPALVGAVRKLLRPLVKLMLAQGMTYTYLADLLKGLFVEVADQDFGLDSKSPTDSRVSLVSGVHRKDVARLRGKMAAREPLTSSVVPLSAQLLAQWMGQAKYLQADGKPMPLARLISEGGELSFEALVAGINSDIRSRVVLDDWLSQGLACLDESGKVCLNSDAFIPSQGADEKAFYLGHNLHDHAAAAVHNVLGRQPTFMERSVHYDALSSESITHLNKMAQDLGMKVLLSLNQAAMEAEKRDQQNHEQLRTRPPDQRFTVGVYFYSEQAQASSEAREQGRSS